MKKHIYAFLLIATATASINAVPTATKNPFSSLTRSIESSADAWITKCISLLTLTQQLMLLNLFLPESSRSDEATMKCMQAIQEDQSLTATFEELVQNMMKPIELYINNMQKKFEALKTNNQDDIRNFITKLEENVKKLSQYFFQVYYEKLYKHIEKQNASALCFMFDENGLIAPEKRVRALPKPTA